MPRDPRTASAPTDLAPALLPGLDAAIVALVNERYEETEGALWRPGKVRTDVDEVQRLAAAGRLLHLCGRTDDPRSLLGAVALYLPETDGVAEFGMLAVSPAAAGQGVGTRLVRGIEERAREHGATTMELEVLRPARGTLEAKERLAGWYPRLGYRLVSTTPAEQARPDLSDVLAVACVIDRYRRHVQ